MEDLKLELVISLSLGLWISICEWIAYRNLKKEYMEKGKSDK